MILPRSATVAASAAILCCGVLGYAGTLHVPFLMDDFPAIVGNTTIRSLAAIGQILQPPPFTGVSGRPVLNLSFALNHAVGGLDVTGYHWVNLALHVCAGLVLFGIARRTLRSPGVKPCFGTKADFVGTTIALLWTVHPLLTNAVTYVSQRAEVLMGLFYLLTLYCFIRAVEGVASPRRGWSALSVLCCLLGLLTKEAMVTAPFIVFVYDCLFIARSPRQAWRQHRTLLGALAATWLLLAANLLWFSRHSIGYAHGVGLGEYLLTECRAVAIYLKLALWPHPLVFDYGPVLVNSVSSALPSALLLLLLAAATLILLWRAPAASFFGIWFFVLLAPSSSIVPVALQPVAESRMYLPLAGIVAAAVIAIERIAGIRWRWCLFVFAALLGIATFVRNEKYHTARSIWSDTVVQRPRNPRAQDSLARALANDGDLGAAVEHYRMALALTPNSALVRSDLGKALHDRGAELFAGGRLPEAQARFAEALEIEPGYVPSEVSLGVIDMALGRVAESMRLLGDAVQRDPTSAEAHYRYGNALAMSGQVAAASQEWSASLRLEPGNPEAHNNLGMALVRQGRRSEAAAEFREALRLRPEYEQARNNLDDLQTPPPGIP